MPIDINIKGRPARIIVPKERIGDLTKKHFRGRDCACAGNFCHPDFTHPYKVHPAFSARAYGDDRRSVPPLWRRYVQRDLL